MKKRKILTVKEMSYCAMFAVLISVGAFIKLPITIVPITLQTVFVILSGLLLGAKLGLYANILYVFIGLCGLPIFSMGGGIGYILYPSFGYLIGFIVASYTIGKLSNRVTDVWHLFLISILGISIIYLCGILYFVCIQYLYLGHTIKIQWIVYNLLLLYIPGDLLSCFIASLLVHRLSVFKFNT